MLFHSLQRNKKYSNWCVVVRWQVFGAHCVIVKIMWDELNVWHEMKIIKLTFHIIPDGKLLVTSLSLFFFYCLSAAVEIINVTGAAETPSNLHENSLRKASITADSKQARRNRCCLVDFDTNSNKWSLGRSSHRVSKDAESQQGNPLNVKAPRRGISSTFTQTITHTISSKSNTAQATLALFPLPDNEAPRDPPPLTSWLNSHSLLLISSRPLWLQTLKCWGSSRGSL